MSLVKFSKADQSFGLNPWVGDIFDTMFNDSFLSDRLVLKVPAVNIDETDEEYTIELAAPGLKRDDFNVSLDRNTLTISVEQKDEKKEDVKNCCRREYSYSSFVRSFNLPDTADTTSVKASYNDGILAIHIAKLEEAKHSIKKIAIQ